MSDRVEWTGVAGCGAFRADGRGVCSSAAGRAVISAARSLLGADYNHGDHAVVAGCGAHGFVERLVGTVRGAAPPLNHQ